MGKYIRKSRAPSRLAFLDLPSSPGVRTRARSLASSQQQQQQHTPYLQLRSRRLHKIVGCDDHHPQQQFLVFDEQHISAHKTSHDIKLSDVTNCDLLDDCSSKFALSDDTKHHGLDSSALLRHRSSRHNSDENSEFAFHDPSSSLLRCFQHQSRSGRVPGAALSRSNSRSNSLSQEPPRGILTRNQRRQEERVYSARIQDMDVDQDAQRDTNYVGNSGARSVEVEVSFGDSPIDEEMSVRDSSQASQCRLVRESTPSSQLRELETPRSTRRYAPSPPPRFSMELEIEEFFADAERQAQALFKERYNFDPVADMPLPGRFDWVSLQPNS